MPIPDDESNAGAIIIELPSVRERPLLSHENERPARVGCFTHRFVLNDDKRTVRCRECGSNFEPFDALVDIVRTWKNYANQLQAYDNEIERLKVQQENIKREVTNLKAQRRRHAERLAAINDVGRCPATNLDRSQCVLPAGHDAGDAPTKHFDPKSNVGDHYGWRMPSKRS